MSKKGYVICAVVIFVIGAIVSLNLERSVDKSIENRDDELSKKVTTTIKSKESDLMEGITLNYHASIRMEKNDKVIYFDPYKIEESNNDADYIFITHSHYDHFDKTDIGKVKKDTTKYIVTSDIELEIKNMGVDDKNILVVYPEKEYNIDDISFETVPAYNTNKTFHKKSYNWVGYVLDINNTKYYVVGDSDITPELKSVKCDVIFIPVGGTYTSDASEAADAVNEMKVKYAVPIHYGVVGSKTDAEDFVSKLDSNIKGVILK